MIRNQTMKVSDSVKVVTDNTKIYLSHLQKSYNTLFATEDISRIVTPFDRSEFYLDECLPSKSYNLGNGDCICIITPMIGVSRIMSNSMYIDPIHKLKDVLMFDQIIELVFITSLLCCPIQFNYTMNKLIHRLTDDSDEFEFQQHPFYDWLDATVSDFGDNWQGGGSKYHRRFVPMGRTIKDFHEMFGKDEEDRKKKKQNLRSIIKILYGYLVWIDKVGESGQIPSIAELREKCHGVAASIKFEYGEFRLATFTSTAIGVGLLQDGKHLRQISYPIKGMASYKHLSNPNKGSMTQEQAAFLRKNQSVVLFEKKMKYLLKKNIMVTQCFN